MLDDPLLITLLAGGALALLAVGFTAVLRVGGFGAHGDAIGPGGWRGTAIAGGIIAGLLAGPSVLGRVAPEFHRAVFLGAVAESRALDEHRARARTDMKAMEAIDVTPVAIEEFRAEQREAAEPLERALREAEADRRRLFDSLAALAAGACVFAGALLSIPFRPGARRGLLARFGRARAEYVRASAVYALIACGVPAVVTSLVAVRDARFAVAFGLAIGCVGLSGSLSGGVRWVAVGVAMLGWMAALAIAPSGLALAVSFAGVVGFALGSFAGRPMKRFAIGGVRWAALPALAALLAVRVDVHGVSAADGFWFMLVAGLLWCSDGRWFAGRMAMGPLAGEGRAWTRSSALINAGPGTLTLVLTLLFAHAGLAGEAFIASALACGAVVELFRGFRELTGPVLDA